MTALAWSHLFCCFRPCQAVVSFCFLQLSRVCSSASYPRSVCFATPSLASLNLLSPLWFPYLGRSSSASDLSVLSARSCLLPTALSQYLHWFMILVSIFSEVACLPFLFSCSPSLFSVFLLLQPVFEGSSQLSQFSVPFPKQSHFPTPRFPLSSAACHPNFHSVALWLSHFSWLYYENAWGLLKMYIYSCNDIR